MTKEEEIFQQHLKIGFPPISEQEQAEMLIWHNVDVINRLTPGFKAEFIPIDVGKRYITLSKSSFREYFIRSGYIEKLNDTHKEFPKLDSQWIEQTTDSKYQLKVQERGGLVYIKFFTNYEEVIDYFVNGIFKTFRR